MTQSHWQATHKAPALESHHPKTADCIVIGGGILGTSAAYWLARFGVKAVLLEQNALAHGATGRNGGFLSAGAALPYTAAIQQLGHSAAKAIWQLTCDNRDLMRDVLSCEGIACDYREPGCLHLHLSDAEWRAAKAEVDALNADGFAHEWLDRPATQLLIDTPLGDTVCGATLMPDAGLLHSSKLVAGVAFAAQRHGATRVQARVTSVMPCGDGVRVSTDAGTIDAGALIIAANAWTQQLVPAMRGFITPVRGQVISYAPFEPIFTRGMGADVTPTGEYWQQTPDGTILIGGCRAAQPDGDVGVMDDAVTDDVQDAIEQVLPALFPSMAGRLQVSRRWSGPMAFTPDFLPVLDAVPGLARAWFAGGFCGHGMPFGMIFGKMMAEAVMRGVLAETAFRFKDRAGSNRMAG